MAVVINASSGAISSFLVFWLVFHEKIKHHRIDGTTVFLAPVWLTCILLGMFGLVYAPKLRLSPPKLGEQPDDHASSLEVLEEDQPLMSKDEAKLQAVLEEVMHRWVES